MARARATARNAATTMGSTGMRNDGINIFRRKSNMCTEKEANHPQKEVRAILDIDL